MTNSDKPGQHDFNVLKKLVLPDGSVLRARYPGRPTRDCLFIDPVMDKRYVLKFKLQEFYTIMILLHFMISNHSLLKIWNLNKCGGVIGIFNCQGAGSWPGLESKAEEDINFELSGKVSPSDIEYFEEVSAGPWTQDCAVFRFNTGMVCIHIVLTVSSVSLISFSFCNFWTENYQQLCFMFIS